MASFRAIPIPWPLLGAMVKREFQSRYAGSVLGVYWAFIQPFLTVAVYFLVFDIVFSMRMGDNAPTQRVGTYLVVGALPWLAFCESLSRGSTSLVEAGNILQKNALPPMLFVLRSVLASGLTFVPMMGLLAILYVLLTGHWETLWVMPFVILLQWVISYLCAHILAILTAASRDTTQLLSFVLSLGIYISPVLFPLSLFPEDWRWLLFINPMTSLVMSYQAILLSGELPDLHLWGAGFIWLMLLACVLNVLIKRSHEELVDWL